MASSFPGKIVQQLIMSARTQRNVVENAQELQDFLKDMAKWEEDMKKTDEEWKKKPQQTPVYPPVRGSQSAASSPSAAANNVTSKTTTTPTAAKATSAASSTALSAKDEALKEKEKGNQLFNVGKYKEAIECYSNSFKLDPENHILPANIAIAYLKLNKYDEAEEAASTSIKMDPTFVKSYLRRGTARMAKNNIAMAKQDFEEALRLDPSNKQAKEDLAKAEKLLKEKQKEQPKQQPQQTKKPTTIPIDEVDGDDDAMPARIQPTISEIVETPAQPKPSQSPATKPQPTPSPTAAPAPTTTTQTPPPEPSPSPKSTTPSPATTQSPSPLPPSSTTPAPSPAKPKAKGTMMTFKVPEIKMKAPTQPPQNAYEFERVWMSFKQDIPSFASYVQMIKAEQLPTLFKTALTPDILYSFIQVLCSLPMQEKGAVVYEYLKHLALVNRFDVVVALLSNKEKQELAQLFDKLATATTTYASYTDEHVASIRKKYGV